MALACTRLRSDFLCSPGSPDIGLRFRVFGPSRTRCNSVLCRLRSMPGPCCFRSTSARAAHTAPALFVKPQHLVQPTGLGVAGLGLVFLGRCRRHVGGPSNSTGSQLGLSVGCCELTARCPVTPLALHCLPRVMVQRLMKLTTEASGAGSLRREFSEHTRQGKLGQRRHMGSVDLPGDLCREDTAIGDRPGGLGASHLLKKILGVVG